MAVYTYKMVLIIPYSYKLKCMKVGVFLLFP